MKILKLSLILFLAAILAEVFDKLYQDKKKYILEEITRISNR